VVLNGSFFDKLCSPHAVTLTKKISDLKTDFCKVFKKVVLLQLIFFAVE